MSARRAGVALALIAALGLCACARESAQRTSSDPAPAARVLEVRGVVRQLPTHAAVPLLIEHEAIPGFVDIRGNPAPMASMTMPFAIADESVLLGLEVGDPIAFRLKIDWETSPSIVVTTIEKLPAGTNLAIGGAGS